MTMHLARGLTMLNTKKPKRQITKAKLKRWAEDLRRYNKDMKRLGMHDHKMTMEQYVEYVHGNFVPGRKKTTTVMSTPWHQSGVA